MASDKNSFVSALREICGDDMITDVARLKVYETDGLTAKKRVPWIVVLPSTVSEVQRIVALCARHKVPVVARGAGTGLSGGAMPHGHGVLLSLAKFNKILEVDENARLARIEPGVTNLAITKAVEHLGLYYAPDPSSQIACTIGGNVAENSGGVHCLKYGLTVHNVMGLKVVSPKGEIYELGGDALDAAGFDLLAVMHGSEGMLGIVVEVTVKLLEKPSGVCVVLAAFDSVNAAAGCVGQIIADGILPAGLEMMDQLAAEAAEAFVHAGYPTDAASLLLCELDGNAKEVQVQHEQLLSILDRCDAKSVSTAWDEAERFRLWQGRKAAFPAVGRIAPDYYCMDGTIPRKELPEVLTAITKLSEQFDLPCANVFHAGDGNLHPLILYDANDNDQLQRAEEFGAQILALCIEKGGTITGEHGVGVEKIDQMCIQFDEQELEIFHGIKSSFDQQGILNPGKAVPTLSRCAEFGAMHVHVGEEKHSDLERF
ncbi:MAG TPA: FAD-binding oxidoreductase [Gammaproteobacteria bacterium]|nr:FAD-binding oxidoreductase [Gammaproteobacteria bacterium]